MPRGDGTGPEGKGPGTGRGAGYCSGFSAPGFMNQGPGRGSYAGRGQGAGRGYHNRFWRTGFMGMMPMAMGLFGDFMYRRYHPQSTAQVDPVTDEQELEALRSEAVHFERALEEIQSRIGELEPKNKKGKE